MKRFSVETAVGLFMVIGFLCFAWLSVRLGDVNLLGSRSYDVTARFGSISGLKAGAQVEIAGVRVGKVADIRLDPQDYDAVVSLAIDRGVKITRDSIASIRTSGIIGDRYVDLSPGGAEEFLSPGDAIEETESAINLEQLVSKYIFEKK
jgi:phospholipid/cholesterol/gamma-HCH transport system substrate-binding protein